MAHRSQRLFIDIEGSTLLDHDLKILDWHIGDFLRGHHLVKNWRGFPQHIACEEEERRLHASPGHNHGLRGYCVRVR